MPEPTARPASTGAPDRLPLTSPDLAAERLARLRELLPGAFAEGKLVPERLAELVGAPHLSSAPERYGLSYAGRGEALREMLSPSNGTLRPDAAASVAWDATENLIVEGDNLHVLKLLQSAYAGAVKLIYIDPPYNTGNDFVYPDNFRQGIAHYKEQTQQTLSTNAETSGRYHSDWLKMMHPRLALARNLLRDDGVIFVSIDDHEVHNLRLLMDEVFGEENFVGCFVWQKRYSRDNRPIVGAVHEYVVLYARDSGAFEKVRGLIQPDEASTSIYRNPNNDPRGRWRPIPMNAQGHRPNQMYEIKAPGGSVHRPPDGRCWSMIEARFEALRAAGRIYFGSDNNGQPNVIRYLSEVEGFVPWTWWPHDETGHTDEAKKEIHEFFGKEDAFDTPKPVRLVHRILQIGSSKHSADLVLDFFAGSGTTAQAVLELNRQDGGNRKFILVQFPEPTGREDFKTIADITRERVRRVIARRPADLATGAAEGFRAYTLSDSNFKLWDGTTAPRDGAALAQQLELMAHNVVEGRSDADLLAEILLKCGHPGVTLSSPVEVRTVAGQPVHFLAGGALAICLGRALTPEILRGVIAQKPKRLLCLDVGFGGNDELKTNTVLEMQSHGIQFQTV